MSFLDCVVNMCNFYKFSDLLGRGTSLPIFLRGTTLDPNTYMCLDHGTFHLCDGINCLLIGDSCVCGSMEGDNEVVVIQSSGTGLRVEEASCNIGAEVKGKAKDCPELLDYLKKTYYFGNVSNMIEDFVKEENFVVPENQLQSIIQRIYALIHAHLCSDLKLLTPSTVFNNTKERDAAMMTTIREELTRIEIKTCPKKDISFTKHTDFARNVSKAITHDLTCSPDQLLTANKTHRKTYTAFEKIRRRQVQQIKREEPQ